MNAFGLNRFAQAFAVAANNAGSRIPERSLEVVDLLAASLFVWGGSVSLSTTFRFLYPFIGGTAVSHSFNLADPAVGRIAWGDTVTHNVNGITGDGVTGYGWTSVTLAGISLTDTYVVCGVYSRTGGSDNYAEIGNWNATLSTGISISCRWSDTNARFYQGQASAFLQPAVVNAQGFFSNVRVSSNTHNCYRNGSLLLSTAISGGAPPDPPDTFVLLQRGSGLNFSARNLAFAFLTNAPDTEEIGAIFSAAKIADLYTRIQVFQTRLGRQI